MTRPALLGVYVVMAVWLIFAATRRIIIQVLGSGASDPVPFISAAIGVVALVLLFALPSRSG